MFIFLVCGICLLMLRLALVADDPVSRVGKYKERALQIRFLTLPQIDEQLRALEDRTLLQTMVAMYIYSGLRKEEALWLTLNDVDLNTGLMAC